MLDTNAVSEPTKPLPNAGFMAWHQAQDPANLFVTTITIAEIWLGLSKLKKAHPEYERIREFASGVPRYYRVLGFDLRAAKRWGEMAGQASGPLPLRDSMIAGIALSRGYRVVTRDQPPFERMGCKVLNPWA